MNYYGAKELANSFRTVRKNTIRIANDIPETSYDYKAAPDTRSVREMLAHIAACRHARDATGVADGQWFGRPLRVRRAAALDEYRCLPAAAGELRRDPTAASPVRAR